MEEFSWKKLCASMSSVRIAGIDSVGDIRVYTMNYQNPYHLDYMLENGVRNTADLLIKATKEISGGIPLFVIPGRYACSSFNGKTPDGKRFLARNFDYKDSPCMVVWCNPEDGYRSVGIADMLFMTYGFKRTPIETWNRYFTLMAPYTVMDGINEKGLCVAVLEQKGKATNQSTSRRNITTTVAIRAILDKCATVDEAITLLDSYDMHDAVFCNYHYHIIDKKGGNVIVEYVDNKMNVVRPAKGKKYQYTTNFLLSNPGGDVKGNFGYSRYYQLRDSIEPKKGVMTIDEAMGLLEHVKLEYRHHLLKHRVTSLWSVVYNIDDLSLELVAGADFSKRYSFSLDSPATK